MPTSGLMVQTNSPGSALQHAMLRPYLIFRHGRQLPVAPGRACCTCVLHSPNQRYTGSILVIPQAHPPKENHSQKQILENSSQVRLKSVLLAFRLRGTYALVLLAGIPFVRPRRRLISRQRSPLRGPSHVLRIDARSGPFRRNPLKKRKNQNEGCRSKSGGQVGGTLFWGSVHRQCRH